MSKNLIFFKFWEVLIKLKFYVRLKDQVLGIKDQNRENLIMTASQEELNSDSYGHMLVYRTNNIIFGTLGYQINPPSCLAGCCNGCCSGGCCTGCCDGCCKDCCCSCKGGCCSECCTCCQGCS